VLHNEEIVVVCVEGNLEQGESYDWESLFVGVTLPQDRTNLPTNKAGNARVVARLRNHGLTQSYTDTRTLDGTVQRRYVVYLRERQRDAATGTDRYFMSPPSGAVFMPRTGSASTRATRGTPPDWYAVPSVLQAIPKLSSAITTVRTQLSRAGTYTSVHTGEAQLLDRTISTLQRDLTQRAAEVIRVTNITSSLDSLAGSSAAASVGMHTILLTSPSGGMAGWSAKLAQSLTNTKDPGRPQYTASAPMTGVVLIAGAPRLPQLASTVALFKLLFGHKKKHVLADLVRKLDTPGAAMPSLPEATPPLHVNAALRPVTTPQC